jgi:putative nucleotidyltransferase with HDIG domain
LVLFAAVYFGLNSALIAFRIALDRQTNAYAVWRSSFMWLSLNYFCGASVAVLLVGNTRTIDLRFVGVVVPLLFVLYFTFKTSMQRVDDAYKHVAQINSLYLSTIETLAMAIDAKDQITHGHIRRVQAYAVGLARHLGVGDEKLIRAIEAAALLHDTGKLAIPEYILNKPGKLSPVEFEKMKEHASIGADILSAIDFPYPVVPIVRYHHENWDGGGYPDGLKGTDIPIGARILSVVDCFDALTSDRPYRPRLSDEAALQILRQRSGTMYDPLVVETFSRVHASIAPKAFMDGPPRHVLNEITAGVQTSHQVPASSDRGNAARAVPKGALSSQELREAFSMFSSDLPRIRSKIPFALGILFLNNESTNELEAAHVLGDGAEFVQGLRIPLGQKLSGWVAVNRQTILNSDAELDLGDIAITTGLRVCLSTPLVATDDFVGVITLYSAAANPFGETDRMALEIFAQRTIRERHAPPLLRA